MYKEVYVLVRLKKYKAQPEEGKKSFHLQVPMSLWLHFENYCDSLNMKPTKAINLLLLEELTEAGIIPANERKNVQLDVDLNEDSKEEKKAQKKKPSKR